MLRPLNLEDFVQSKAKVSCLDYTKLRNYYIYRSIELYKNFQVGPSVAYDAASMNELRKWNEQYGEGGSRRKSPFGF